MSLKFREMKTLEELERDINVRLLNRKSKPHILTKKEIEQGRSAAYKYAI